MYVGLRVYMSAHVDVRTCVCVFLLLYPSFVHVSVCVCIVLGLRYMVTFMAPLTAGYSEALSVWQACEKKSC